ncbi:unnamed protein product [Leptosia nina]|uniref:Uncharacterized protein n=1 Tax=Leptosia nina TaxID=320188 RepID=A0AAV1JMW5_9NEOP
MFVATVRPPNLSLPGKILQFVHRHLQCAYLNVNKEIKKRPPEAFPLNRDVYSFHQWAKRARHIHNDITAAVLRRHHNSYIITLLKPTTPR